MYQLINNGYLVGSYLYFCDAWLHAYLNFSTWSLIINHEDKWIVNPPIMN